MDLKDLCGTHVLSGVERGFIQKPCDYIESADYMAFTLDGVTYRAVEDPEDGYRSCCRDIEIIEHVCAVRLPDVQVECTHKSENGYESMDVLTMTDVKSGLPILEIGTGNTNDYYPYFVCEWTPENMDINIHPSCG